VKFVKDYAAAGLKDSIPLVGAGFLTDGTLEARATRPTVCSPRCTRRRAEHAEGQRVPLNYAKTYKMQPDVYAMQGSMPHRCSASA